MNQIMRVVRMVVIEIKKDVSADVSIDLEKLSDE